MGTGDGAAGMPGREVAGPTAASDVVDPTATDRRLFAGKRAFWWVWPPLVALDLWSKHWVFALVYDAAVEQRAQMLPESHRPPVVVFHTEPLHFELVTWGNTGTIWGIFQDSTVPLMVVRCAAVVALLWFVRNTARAATVQLVVLALVFSGALGNLYDNFVREDRSVRDFLHFSGKWPVQWDFPAFNVADSCITVGAICLFALLWRDDRKPKGRPVS